MRKLLVTFSLILALFGSSVIVNAAVQKGTVNISSTLDGEVLIDGSDSQIDIGSVMDLDATEVGDGNEFAFWIVNGFVRTDLPAETQLRVQSKMNLVAVFRSEGKHAVLFVDSNGKLIDDVYVADGEIATAPSTEGLTKPGGLTVVADEANRWISLEGNTSLADINSSRVYVLQYEMPATSVDIMAIGAVVDIFTANKNDVVTIVAADTDNFKYWADEDGNVLSYNSTYSFTALEEVIIEAESEKVKAAESFVVMQDLTGIRSGHVSYMGRYELHGGDELVEFGFIYGNTIGDIEMGMPNVDVAISNVANPATNEFLMSFVNEHHVTARAYAIVRNGEAIRTIYSDLVVKPNVQEIEAIRTTSGEVTSYGIVSGIMGTKYVFVQQKDGSAGIVLYNATIPSELAVGDEVIIRGTMGAFRGLVQINNGEFEILNSGNTVPLAEDTVTSLSSLAIADQGRRFSIDGLTVVSASGQNLVVKDASNNEITIRVDQESYTDLMDFVASLVPGEVINLVDMHLIWYDGAQFSFNSLSEIVKNAEGTEDYIKSILTSLNGSEYNENTTVALPDTIAGVTVTWTYPEGLVVDGKFKLVDEDTNFDLTATFTVPGRAEVTQQVTINIKDVPAGTKVEEVIYETGFESSDGFTASTTYNNTTIKSVGDPYKWGVMSGTPATNDAITGSNSLQMRMYNSTGVQPYLVSQFTLSEVTKIEFNAKNTSGNNVEVSISTDGTNFVSSSLFTLTTSSVKYIYMVPEEYANEVIYIKFSYIAAASFSDKSKVIIDDVVVYGMVDSELDPLTIENEIKSSITTELDGKSFNEGSNITLPSELLGVSISWDTEPSDLIVDGKFKEVESDLSATMTATFTVPGRVEVTQQVTINIKDVPEGTAEPVVLLTSDFGATNDGTNTSYANYFQDSVVNVAGGTSTYYRAGGNYNGSNWDYIALGQKSVAARLGDMVSNSTLKSAVDASDPNVMVATGFKLGNVTSIVISMPLLKAGTTVYLQSSIDGVNWTSVDSLAPSAISSLTDISFSNINISGEVFFRIIFENSAPTSKNGWLGQIKTISFLGVNPA